MFLSISFQFALQLLLTAVNSVCAGSGNDADVGSFFLLEEFKTINLKVQRVQESLAIAL